MNTHPLFEPYSEYFKSESHPHIRQAYIHARRGNISAVQKQLRYADNTPQPLSILLTDYSTHCACAKLYLRVVDQTLDDPILALETLSEAEELYVTTIGRFDDLAELPRAFAEKKEDLYLILAHKTLDETVKRLGTVELAELADPIAIAEEYMAKAQRKFDPAELNILISDENRYSRRD